MDANDGVVIVDEFAALYVLQPERSMRALAGTALGSKRESPVAIAYARGMDQQCLAPGSGKGESEHQCIVQSEGAHRPVAVQRTLALAELIAADEQAALTVEHVFDDVLIASVGQAIDGCVAIARVEVADELAVFGWSQCVVNRQREEQFAILVG